ncbi:MAG TPA: glycosyltransferase family 4 protein [Acidimicrobiales bacterium]|nr:glycosyltransferase family 4 protein [Acidimicrobiales bacterium]
MLPFERSVVTFHLRSLLDAWAVRHLRPTDVQVARAEWIASRRAGLSLAYSQRVGRHLGTSPRIVPIAYPTPSESITPVEEPVAALIADWSWPPNRRSLHFLLKNWADVRRRVTGAQLLLAGRNLGDTGIGAEKGIELIGAVSNSTEVLSRAAVVAFPCPSSSGPKMKVLEALSYGLPVVSTPPGLEGVFAPPGSGSVVASPHNFVQALSELLLNPEQRAMLGKSGREAVIANHSPTASAQARIDAIRDAFSL